MKLSKLFLGLILVGCGFVCSACSEDEKPAETCADSGITCAKENNATVKACCTNDGKSCKYVAGSKTFQCASTCSSTDAEAAVNYCMGS